MATFQHLLANQDYKINKKAFLLKTAKTNLKQ